MDNRIQTKLSKIILAIIQPEDVVAEKHKKNTRIETDLQKT